MTTDLFFGGENIRNEILRRLQAKKIPFQHLTHKTTHPHEVAKELGVSIEEGIKCLLVRGKKSKKNYLVSVLGHQRVDMRAISDLFREPFELEKIETIKELFGLEVGAIPPFAELLGLDLYFDTHIQSCKEVIFSCGLAHESIRTKLSDLFLLIHPKFAKLV